jgi:hypothetical protein
VIERPLFTVLASCFVLKPSETPLPPSRCSRLVARTSSPPELLVGPPRVTGTGVAMGGRLVPVPTFTEACSSPRFQYTLVPFSVVTPGSYRRSAA